MVINLCKLLSRIDTKRDVNSSMDIRTIYRTLNDSRGHYPNTYVTLVLQYQLERTVMSEKYNEINCTITMSGYLGAIQFPYYIEVRLNL